MQTLLGPGPLVSPLADLLVTGGSSVDLLVVAVSLCLAAVVGAVLAHWGGQHLAAAAERRLPGVAVVVATVVTPVAADPAAERPAGPRAA